MQEKLTIGRKSWICEQAAESWINLKLCTRQTGQTGETRIRQRSGKPWVHFFDWLAQSLLNFDIWLDFFTSCSALPCTECLKSHSLFLCWFSIEFQVLLFFVLFALFVFLSIRWSYALFFDLLFASLCAVFFFVLDLICFAHYCCLSLFCFALPPYVAFLFSSPLRFFLGHSSDSAIFLLFAMSLQQL